MKHLLFVIALLLCMSTSAFQSHGSSNAEATVAAAKAETVVIERFQGMPINSLSVGHAFQTTIQQGTQTGVTLRIDSRLKPYLVCTLNNGRFTLGFDNLPRELQATNKWVCPATASVTVSRLDRISASGMAQVNPAGEFTAQDGCGIHTSGVAQINGLTLLTNGKTEIVCSGASMLTGLNLGKPSSVIVEISGTSGANLTCQTGVFDVDASGTAHLTASGSAQRVKIEASGTAGVNAEGLKTQTANCEASGVASIRCWTTEALTARASGTASVRFRADNGINMNVSKSGLGSVSKL